MAHGAKMTVVARGAEALDSVHLARGRAHLREINAQARRLPDPRPASLAVALYVALFNQRDWDGLRTLLPDGVKLHQSLHPLRVGRGAVGLFFTLYGEIDGVSLTPAWLEGREVLAVFEDRADPKPSYVMWLESRDGRISFIRDYRYASYVTADAVLMLAANANHMATAPQRAVHLAQAEAPLVSWRRYLIDWLSCGGSFGKESTRGETTDRQYAAATLRNRDFTRHVLPMTGVIFEIASGPGEHTDHFARNFPALVF